MSDSKKILISGAGIGGLTAAFFLYQYGFAPVVIEKSNTLRDNGYMIDFFSSGVHVSEQMGIVQALRKKDHGSSIIKQFNEKTRKACH